MSTKHRDQIIEAALSAFLRYGYRRVTMGDISREAGLSRPTVYGAFCNTEQIFRAVVAEVNGRALAEIRERIEPLDSLADQLEQVFEVLVIRAFELIHQSPDAEEIVECTHEFGRDVIEEGYTNLEALLASIIEPHATRSPKPSVTPEHLAHVLAMSARGMKAYAADVKELRELVGGLITMTVATLSAEPLPRIDYQNADAAG